MIETNEARPNGGRGMTKTKMVSELYDALKDANDVSEEKARKAAEAMSQLAMR